MPKIDKNFKSGHGLTSITDTQNNNNAGANYDNYQKEKSNCNS